MFKKKWNQRLISGILSVLLSLTMIPTEFVNAEEVSEVQKTMGAEPVEECLHTEIELINATVSTCTQNGYTGDWVCSDCGAVVQAGNEIYATGHIPYIDDEVAPTCYTTGLTRGYHCAVCNEIITAQETIPATGEHSYKVVNALTKKADAKAKKNGSITKQCAQPGCEEKIKETVYYPKTIKLSTTKVTYNGKSRKPSVSVKDSKGKKISSKDYTVSYKNNKNPGTATVTVKFKNNYTGTVKKTFKIDVKPTSVSKVSAEVGGFTVKWKKQSGQTSGYQIQYSAGSSFKNAKTITVKNNKATSKKISKLAVQKKYYVRIRTYKNVKSNGKTKKLYSKWSSKKSVTTKTQPSAVYLTMIALKSQYPEGMPWTNDNFYAWKGGIYTGGYSCAGFAFILSDAAFGNAPARIHTNFDAIRVGDILRVNYDTHSVIVLEVYKDHVIVAEGNYNSSIHWGREISVAAIKQMGTYVMTRY